MSRIFVCCPDYSPPSGGIRKLYRHVDVLNRHGFEAVILHTRAGFRCTWFASDTPVTSADRVSPTRDDILVLPEICGPGGAAFAPGVRKVVFNQNGYFTFRGYTLDLADLRTPYTSPEVVAALAVSEDTRNYLHYAFPNLPVHRIRYGIDTALFHEPPEKPPAIGFMPRKNPDDVTQVINLLKHRGSLAGWRLCPIDGRSEQEVASVLGGCAVFLSFGHPEGFGLPALEAMACGCAVVGYHGRGGREFFDPSFSRPVEAGDVIGFARVAEALLRSYPSDPTVRQIGRAAAAHVREHYSFEREEQSIVAAWRAILGDRAGRPGRLPSPVGTVQVRVSDRQRTVRIAAGEGWLAKEVFEQHEYGGIPAGVLRDPPVVVDVGAHVGMFALYARLAYHPDAVVHCFEPYPLNVELLRANVAGLAGVTVHAVGLGPADAEAELLLHPTNSAANSTRADLVPVVAGRARIRLRNAGAVWDELALSEVDVLKVDTEGAEVGILESLGPRRLAGVRVVLVEYHSAEDRVQVAGLLPGHVPFAETAHTPRLGVAKYLRADLVDSHDPQAP